MSAELQLAIVCCRYPRVPATQEAIRAALGRPINWPAFETIVQRHRIAGLAASALCADDLEIAIDVRRRLAEVARHFAKQDLIHAAETTKLQQVFDQAGIPCMFLKGVAVGVLAYGGLGVKQSWDIDLLTTEARMTQALRLLELSGYRLVNPVGLPRRALPRFVRFHHEVELRNDNGITVELHWRLFRRPVLTGITATSETQIVRIGGCEVRTLRQDLLIAYLIAHGQEHGWGRLKWIADLNALLAQGSASQLVALHARASELGLESKASAAQLLCARLFGLPLEKGFEAVLRQDRAAERLVEVNLNCLMDPLTAPDKPTLSRTGLALMASRFDRRRGVRALFGELSAIWTQPAARSRYPAAFDFVYHLLRVPVWVLRLPVRLYELSRAKRAC